MGLKKDFAPLPHGNLYSLPEAAVEMGVSARAVQRYVANGLMETKTRRGGTARCLSGRTINIFMGVEQPYNGRKR